MKPQGYSYLNPHDIVWNPIFTRFWPHEVRGLARELGIPPRQIDAPPLQRMITVDVDDTSIRGKYLNFWDITHIFLFKKLGPAPYLLGKTACILDCEKQLDDDLDLNFDGAMSVRYLHELFPRKKGYSCSEVRGSRRVCIYCSNYRPIVLGAAEWADRVLREFQNLDVSS